HSPALMTPRPPLPTLFPYTTLFRSGHDPAIAPGEYDPARAKALLAEAGYPDGFNLTLHCYNDRFSGDVQTCQTLAAMFTAVGIRDRKSTRLNSSHVKISYAVFCLKK